jgi:hypothetical protein
MKRRAKDDGSGSWDGGYECPGIVIVKADQTFNYDTKQRVTFYAGSFEAPPTSQDKIGWVFKMGSAPSGLLGQVMVQVPGSSTKWYIPYRWLSGDFTYTNPWNDYKYIEGYVSNDSKVNYRFRLLLPYLTGPRWAINDEEGKKIAGFLNVRRGTHRGIVINDKQAATSAANTYIANKSIMDSLTEENKSFTATKAKQIEEKTSLTSELARKKATFDENATKIQDLESQLKVLKADQETLNQQITSIGGQINAIEIAIDDANAKGTTAAEKAKALEPAVNQATKDIKAALSDLKTEAPNRAGEIDAAQTAILAKDKPTFSANLAKILP